MVYDWAIEISWDFLCVLGTQNGECVETNTKHFEVSGSWEFIATQIPTVLLLF